jgi:hypothetical protein
MCYPPSDSAAHESSKGRKRHTAAHRPRLFRSPPPTLSRFRVVEDDGPHVTFEQSKNAVHVIETALSCLGGDRETDRSQLWYNRADIKEFRKEAAAISKRQREQPNSCRDECTRGLELRTSLERQERKQMIVRRILDAQDNDSDASELAQIAQEHSIWSRKLALAQAHKDYYAAYHPTLSSCVPELPALLDCRKDLVRAKRSFGVSFEQPTGRRVRCRMF